MNKLIDAIAFALLMFVCTVACGFVSFFAIGIVSAASLPQGTALFETSLQSRISSTDTSMTLVSTSTASGEVLPSGYHCFTLDEGRTDAEYVCGTLTSAKAVTGLTRGISYLTGTSSVSANQHAHRVGADVKMADFPLLQILRNQANGADTYPNPLRYAAGVTPLTSDDLTDKGYVDSVAFSGAGVIDASSVARGVVELATQTETASSTSTGSSGTLVITNSSATSTYNSATAALRVPVTQNSGKLDSNFISTSTLFAYTFPAARPAASSTALLSDTSGTVTWNGVSTLLSASTTVAAQSNSTASSTIYTATIPANVLGKSNAIRVVFDTIDFGGSTGSSWFIEAAYGNATTSTTVTNSTGGTVSVEGNLILYVTAQGATNSQNLTLTYQGITTGVNAAPKGISFRSAKAIATDSTASQQLIIRVNQSPSGGMGLGQINNAVVTELLRL